METEYDMNTTDINLILQVMEEKANHGIECPHCSGHYSTEVTISYFNGSYLVLMLLIHANTGNSNANTRNTLTDVVYPVLTLILSSFGVGGNVISFWVWHAETSSNITIFLLKYLSVWDIGYLLSTVVLMSLKLRGFKDESYKEILCLQNISQMVSVHVTLLIALCRWIAVKYPLRIQRTVTSRRVYTMCVVVVLYAILLEMLGTLVIPPEKIYVKLHVCLSLPLLVLVSFNVSIVWTVYQSASAQKKLLNSQMRLPNRKGPRDQLDGKPGSKGGESTGGQTSASTADCKTARKADIKALECHPKDKTLKDRIWRKDVKSNSERKCVKGKTGKKAMKCENGGNDMKGQNGTGRIKVPGDVKNEGENAAAEKQNDCSHHQGQINPPTDDQENQFQVSDTCQKQIQNNSSGHRHTSMTQPETQCGQQSLRHRITKAVVCMSVCSIITYPIRISFITYCTVRKCKDAFVSPIYLTLTFLETALPVVNSGINVIFYYCFLSKFRQLLRLRLSSCKRWCLRG